MYVILTNTSINADHGSLGSKGTLHLTFLRDHVAPESDLTLYRTGEGEPTRITCTFAEFAAWLDSRQPVPDVPEYVGERPTATEVDL